MRRTALTGLVAALALVAAGCGGEDDGGSGSGAQGVEPDAYAANVCGAISGWQKELQTSVSTMSGKVGASSSPADIKKQLVSFMEAATASTQSMVTKVKGAGTPDVENGEALQRDLVKGLEDAQTAFAAARDDAKSLPENDPVAFQREAQELSATLNREGTAIGQTFNGLSDKYDSDELNEAFDKEPACKTL